MESVTVTRVTETNMELTIEQVSTGHMWVKEADGKDLEKEVRWWIRGENKEFRMLPGRDYLGRLLVNGESVARLEFNVG